MFGQPTLVRRHGQIGRVVLGRARGLGRVPGRFVGVGQAGGSFSTPGGNSVLLSAVPACTTWTRIYTAPAQPVPGISPIIATANAALAADLPNIAAALQPVFSQSGSPSGGTYTYFWYTPNGGTPVLLRYTIASSGSNAHSWSAIQYPRATVTGVLPTADIGQCTAGAAPAPGTTSSSSSETTYILAGVAGVVVLGLLVWAATD